jgi:hypothetical protein
MLKLKNNNGYKSLEEPTGIELMDLSGWVST